jgi:hypothetical protein
VRDERELERIAAYIEENPVNAGLVQRAEEYKWSSANAGKIADAAGRIACATI